MKPVFAMLLTFLLPMSSLAATPPQAIAPPSADQAQVIFLKPKNAGARTMIFERGPGGSKELGGLPGESKLVVNIAPGEHRFMANTSSKVHFLEAKLEAGKRYYVLMRFLYGQGFQLRPIRRDLPSDYRATAPDFKDWVENTRIVAPASPDAPWIEHFTSLTDEAIAHGQKGWDLKNDAQRAELTLQAEDSLP